MVLGVKMEQECWTLELEGMPHFDQAMERVYAWYENEIIDRPPIRFQAHNAILTQATEDISGLSPEKKKEWWFNVELQVDLFARYVEGRRFQGETFPVYSPNLGPDVYAAFYGTELEFGEITSWSKPLVKDWDDIEKIQFDRGNEYFRALEKLTELALERCKGKFMVGYTDLHPGLDCVAAWRGPEQMCIDMMDDPDKLMQLAELSVADFHMIFDHFDTMLKAENQLSVSWLGVPSFQKMHIPSEDVSTLISPEFYRKFGLPLLKEEVKNITHHVYHIDGKGVARHLDDILSVPEVNAVQWVQGMGDDYPIMQWVPFIKELQARETPVIVDLATEDLEAFTSVMDPKGLFLWTAPESEAEELEILKAISKWT